MDTIPMNFINGKITIHPDICNGKPTIRGKRISVQTVLEFLSAGETQEEIMEQFPSLEAGDISACLIFATQLMDHKYILKEVA